MAFVRPGAKKQPPMSRSKRVSAMDALLHAEENHMKLSKVHGVLQRIQQFLHTSKQDLMREMSLVTRIAPDIPRWLDLTEQEQLEVYTGIKALEQHAPTMQDDRKGKPHLSIAGQAPQSPRKASSRSALQSRVDSFASPKRSKFMPKRVFTPMSAHTLPPQEYTVHESELHHVDALTTALLQANNMSYIVSQEILESPSHHFNVVWHQWLNEGSKPAPRSTYRRLYVKDAKGVWLTHREMMNKLSKGDVIHIIERTIGSPDDFATTYRVQSSHSSRAHTPSAPSLVTTPRESPSALEEATDDTYTH